MATVKFYKIINLSAAAKLIEKDANKVLIPLNQVIVSIIDVSSRFEENSSVSLNPLKSGHCFNKQL